MFTNIAAVGGIAENRGKVNEIDAISDIWAWCKKNLSTNHRLRSLFVLGKSHTVTGAWKFVCKERGGVKSPNAHMGSECDEFEARATSLVSFPSAKDWQLPVIVKRFPRPPRDSRISPAAGCVDLAFDYPSALLFICLYPRESRVSFLYQQERVFISTLAFTINVPHVERSKRFISTSKLLTEAAVVSRRIW